jgi:predicted site-specific integrase-resolvase
MRERRLWPTWQSISEWSRSLGIERKILYEWHRQGMPIYRVGTKRKVLTEDIVRFIRANLKTVEPSR